MFSERTAWDLGETAFALRVADRRRHPGLVDLTIANPTRCGFQYPENLLLPLAAADAAIYDPAPLGALVARQAVATYYADHNAAVPVDRLCMTTGTSEAYSFLFRLLCDPGDEVLVAQPSYPLFDFIARLDDVRLREFPLCGDPGAPLNTEGWSIDLHALSESIGPRTRAVVLVHPNNPTGNFVSAAERAALNALCAERGLALIVDEVFLDYALEAQLPQTFAAERGEGFSDGLSNRLSDRLGDRLGHGCSEALCFVLSGISKICALPQMKASWIAACGPDGLVSEAMGRLEVIADTFLSMNAPVQHALGPWMRDRRAVQSQIIERARYNLKLLDTRLEGSCGSRYAVGGGWTAVLRVPREVDGHAFADAALDLGVLVQPGEFYGFGPGRIVGSLLTPSEEWRRGLALLPL